MLARMYDSLKQRIALLVTKTVLNVLDDTGAIQKLTLTGLRYDRRSNVDRFQEFGFSSSPPEGAEFIMLSIGGDRSHNVAVASEDRRYRPKNLASGETMFYNKFGDSIKLKADGTMEVVATTKVNITSPLVQISGNLIVDGNITSPGTITGLGLVGTTVTDAGGTLGSLRTVYNSHTHGVTTAPGTTTGPSPTV